MNFYDFAEKHDGLPENVSDDFLAVGIGSFGSDIVLQWGAKHRVLDVEHAEALIVALMMAVETIALRRVAETN